MVQELQKPEITEEIKNTLKNSYDSRIVEIRKNPY
jgi:hypothetical protein